MGAIPDTHTQGGLSGEQAAEMEPHRTTSTEPPALATFLIKTFRHFVVSTNILIGRQKPLEEKRKMQKANVGRTGSPKDRCLTA